MAKSEVCRWLRCKGAYAQLPGTETWEEGTSGVDAYWCLRTMEAFGPDEQLVHADLCHLARRCFSARDPSVS